MEEPVLGPQYHDRYRRFTRTRCDPARHRAGGVPLFEYTPMQVKQAVVGYGKAEKHQVMDMTRRLLRLDRMPRPDDAADAIAIALCHARSSTSQLARLMGGKP